MWISLVWFSMWRSTGARRCCWALPAPTLHRFWLPPACARSAAAWLTGWTPRRPRAASGCGLSNAATRYPHPPFSTFWHCVLGGEGLRAVERGDNVPEPPVFQILALDPAVADAFTEQPSLQTGRRAVSDAPISLLQLLAIGLLQRRLGLRDGSEASALLGNHFAGWGRQLPRLQSASRQLREGRRTGNRHTPVRRLSIDRDGRLAFNNAVRTAVAVSLAN